MVFDEFMHCLLELQTSLLSMPEELTLTTVFQNEQDRLSALLENLGDFTEDEQERARAQMRLFADQLNLKLEQLQDRFEGLRQNIDNTQLRLKGMKAYTKGRMI
ncbi:hypothetical protein [Candidatus Paracaedibacter symbiosus]|uniref:hypothetical protein n=1 Tax=Candidatus Paracaedibacter symbiosus TaxID=244582 RepID=UPI00050940BA|nr:hypothetical protein [Candidatus Paracaedibacter symbiosus]